MRNTLCLLASILTANIFAESTFLTNHPYYLADVGVDSHVVIQTNKTFRSINQSNKRPSISAGSSIRYLDKFMLGITGSSINGAPPSDFTSARSEFVVNSEIALNFGIPWQLVKTGYLRYLYPEQTNQTYGEYFLTYKVNIKQLEPYITYSRQLNTTPKPANSSQKVRRTNTELGIRYSYENVAVFAATGDWQYTGRYYLGGIEAQADAYTLRYTFQSTKSHANVKNSYNSIALIYNSHLK